MKNLLTRHIASLMKAAILLCLLWAVAMLALFWRTGTQETSQALAEGKRFIIHIADGKIEGKMPAEQAQAKPELIVPPPPVNEPEPEATKQVSVQPSSNPIADVSEELLDKSAGVPLPKIAESGAKPWQYYSKPFRRMNELPLIAIVITGLGQSQKETELALGMDDRIGLSFSPYASAIASWTTSSRVTGHEMYVELPLQTETYPADDLGPYSILVSKSNTENLKNLMWAMSRFQGYAGVVAPPGEVVTHNSDSFAPLRSEIAGRGIMFLMARDAIVQEPGKKDKNPLVNVNADVWIDEELSEMSIQARLATLEQVAQRNGMAIGISRSYPLSINQIKHWQENLGSHGITLAPASFVAKLKNP